MLNVPEGPAQSTSGKPDWGYPSDKPCAVCGGSSDNQSEPRFGYVVCRKHQNVPPNQLEQACVQWISSDWDDFNAIGCAIPREVPLIVSGPYTPEYATDGSAAFDLRYWGTYMAWLDKMKSVEIEPGDTVRIPTGLKFKIPYGYELQIRPRSGLASRGIVAQFGTVDSDYRGFVDVILHNNSNQEIAVEHGDRIAQAVLAPVIRAVFVQGEVTDDTARGSGGFGSTGI